MDITELRRGDRFLVATPIHGSFGETAVSLQNASVAGVKVEHAQPLRIGTLARLSFRWREIGVNVQARVVWSHLSRSADADGKLLYHSGLRLENADIHYSDALSALIAAHALQLDSGTLDRKRQRLADRQRTLAANLAKE